MSGLEGKTMKITLIKVGMGGLMSSDAMEPLAFAVIAALTPENIGLNMYDERVEALPDKLDCDWLVMSSGSFTIRRTYALAQKYRALGIKVAIGGFHTSLLAEETLDYADVAFVGDAEGLWSEFIEDIQKGKYRRIYKQEEYPCIAKSYYDESIFKGKNYTLIKPLQFSRGCRYSCDFCSISAVYKKSLRYRDMDMVVEEIKRRKLKYVFIVDDNLFLHRGRTMDFLEGIKSLKIKWACQISIDLASDTALIEKMVASGCIAVLIGFETVNPDNLKLMNKQANIQLMDYRKVIKTLNAYGLMIYGTFVLGYDHDTLEAFDATLEFALENRLMLANFNPLIPTVGTPLYRRMEEEGRLLFEKWWLEPGYCYGDTVYQPKNFSPEELKEGCFRIRSQFNRYSNIGKRWIMNKQNVKNSVIYLGANMINRREILKKQGREL
jgi:radical SAM superfamily enzyme YgiQ (UPF0313 family)